MLKRLKEVVVTSRLSFSERIGLKKIRVGFQKDGMTPELKNRLWSVVCNHYWGKITEERSTQGYYLSCPGDMVRKVWDGYYKQKIWGLPDTAGDIQRLLDKKYDKLEWNEVYDYIDFIACSDVVRNRYDFERQQQFCLDCNRVLEEEMSAYRFVDGAITPIIEDVYIKSIEDSINKSTDGASEHMKAALRLYSQRNNPDYRNSIKEAISAVESVAKRLVNEPKLTLGKALDEMNKRDVGIHSALVNGFKSIYGWASDEGGIRHGMAELEIVKEEDARVMLVMCSAFINYLMVKSELSR